MRRLLPTLAAILVILAGVSIATRVSATATGSGPGPCDDPTSPCWTNGKPVYLAKIVQASIDPNRPYLTIASRLLNTGPDMPHLVAAVNGLSLGRFRFAEARLDTVQGTTVIPLHRIIRHHWFLWDLGPIPNGSILTFTIHADFPRDPGQVDFPDFYTSLPAQGPPPASSRVRRDAAPFARSAIPNPRATPSPPGHPSLTPLPPRATPSNVAPLGRTSLHWLNFGSGFRLVAPRSGAAVSEVAAARTAAATVSVGVWRARVLEAGLRTLVQEYQNYPMLTGRTFWVFSMTPANPRVRVRWFFVLVDAQTGKVARVLYQGTIIHLSGHLAGEPPLVHLPGVSGHDQAMLSLLLYASHSRVPVTRQQAMGVVRHMVPFSRSPRHDSVYHAVLAWQWPWRGKPIWFITRRIYRRNPDTHRRFAAIQMTEVDASTGKLLNSFCCFAAQHGTRTAP